MEPSLNAAGSGSKATGSTHVPKAHCGLPVVRNFELKLRLIYTKDARQTRYEAGVEHSISQPAA